MMKTIVKYLFFTMLLVLAAGLVAPGFVNWNQHKDKIASVLQRYIARDVAIAGNVKFRLVPQPQLLLGDVTVANSGGPEPFLRLKTLEARIRFMPLLQGQVEVENINLVEPRLNLEVGEDGKGNWAGLLKEQAAAQPARTGITAAAIRLNKVTVTGGAVRYASLVTGAERQAEDLNLDISADTLLGPYRVAGNMRFQDATAAVTLETGVRDGAGRMPLKAAFLPAGGLPRVKIDGTFDLSEGLDVQGELDVRDGPLAPLLGDAFFDRVGFLAAPGALTAALSFHGGEAKLDDITATFGEGTLKGGIALQAERGKRPQVSMDLAAEKLDLSAGPGLPSAFDLSLKLKGKNVSWEGTKLSSVTFAADANGTDWAVRQLRAFLPGKSDIRIAGIVTPKSGVSSLNIQFDTEDLGKMLAAAPLGPNNALKLLADSGVVKKLRFASTFDLKSNNISLSDIDAVIEEKIKMSGSLDVARGTQKPAYVAKLKFDGWDAAALGSGAWDSFLKTLQWAEGDLLLDVANYTNGAMKVPNLKINGRVDDSGLTLKDVTGVLSENEGFDLSGRVSLLSLFGAFDVEYGVRTADGAAFAKAFGLPLPPPLHDWQGASLHGKLKGKPDNYTFTAEGKVNGGTVAFDGSFGQEAGYKAAFHFMRPEGGLAMTNLPLEKLLVAQGGAVDFSGTLSGVKGAYSIDGISSTLGGSPLSGTVALKDGKYAADLAVEKIDLDKWLWNDWLAKEGMTLTLRGKTLVWDGLTIADPALDIVADEASVKIRSLTGKLWGGDLDLSAEARKSGAWSSTLKGGVKGADLDNLRALLGVGGLTLGKGSLALDVKSDSPKFFGTLPAVSGTLALKADSLTTEDFAPDEVAAALENLSHPALDLQRLINNALKEKGKGAYTGVDIPLKLRSGQAAFENVTLSGHDHTLTSSGSLDLASGRYELNAAIHLNKPAGAPAISITREDTLKNTGTYGVDIRGVESWIGKKFGQPQPEPKNGKAAVQGIMERLDDGAPAAR